MRRDLANKNAEFPQLVSAMRLSSEECLEFVQVGRHILQVFIQ